MGDLHRMQFAIEVMGPEIEKFFAIAGSPAPGRAVAKRKIAASSGDRACDREFPPWSGDSRPDIFSHRRSFPTLPRKAKKNRSVPGIVRVKNPTFN